MEMLDNDSGIVEGSKQVLETLLDLMDVSAEVAIAGPFMQECTEEDENVPTSVVLNVEGDDLGILIGRRGQTLASLQYVIRLITYHTTNVKLPIIIDVEGYKRRRCEALKALVLRMAEQVRARRTSFALEPMPAFERRVIHLALLNHPHVTTESTGVGESRKVVIVLK